MAKITQYESRDGVVPFQKWFSSLGVRGALKVRTAIAQMEAGNFGDRKSVGGGVWERRINVEKAYRVYYAKDGDELVILLAGGTKSRQQSDIEMASQYWSEYKNRKKAMKETQDKEKLKAKSSKRSTTKGKK